MRTSRSLEMFSLIKHLYHCAHIEVSFLPLCTPIHHNYAHFRNNRHSFSGQYHALGINFAHRSCLMNEMLCSHSAYDWPVVAVKKKNTITAQIGNLLPPGRPARDLSIVGETARTPVGRLAPKSSTSWAKLLQLKLLRVAVVLLLVLPPEQGEEETITAAESANTSWSPEKVSPSSPALYVYLLTLSQCQWRVPRPKRVCVWPRMLPRSTSSTIGLQALLLPLLRGKPRILRSSLCKMQMHALDYGSFAFGKSLEWWCWWCL